MLMCPTVTYYHSPNLFKYNLASSQARFYHLVYHSESVGKNYSTYDVFDFINVVKYG